VNQPALLPDKIHPNTLGAAISAHRLYELLVQKNDHKYDIFSKIKEPLKVTSYYGYSCASFTFQGRSCKVVKPKWSAPGRPWIWRARFWGHEPQTEIALLERGFHVVYCDVAELFGNDEAIAAWNGFYTMLNKAGLSKKNVLEGMSRGAVYALNWAAENPNKVSAVYIDNPLLDMKSWPCGLGKVSASPQELAAFKKDYNITTDEQLRAFKNSPVDKVSQIVRGGYPILILCADADEAAVPDDNTIPFEEKMRNLNGKLTIMHKPGFKHYPHSFPNPAPIVDFILKSTGYAVGLN
jgi:Predicted esterase